MEDAMRTVLPMLLLLVSASLLAGCALSPVYLANYSELAHRLPDGVSMNDFVERDVTGVKVTVGMKLARLGAYPGRDGKIYDWSGQRIEFFRHYDGGMQPPDFVLEHAERHLQELKKTSRVIEIFRDPDLPHPV
jgi:hypothetical protein